MSNYADLITRLEALEGPSYELDALIECATGSIENYCQFNHKPSNVAGKVTCHNRGGTWITYWSPAFTGSIDAAVLLATRVLPGWSWLVTASRDTRWRLASALVTKDEEIYESKASNPAIALCIAILRALDAKEKQIIEGIAA